MSTDDQTEYSPDAQLKALKHYAKQNNIVLTNEHIYIDEGISGRKADKRPAFQLMVATAKSKPKPFDVILVHKFDRFARSREDSVVYKSLLKREADVKVISTTESIEDDKFSVILEAMLEAMAEYYSLNLAEEVLKGMTEKAHRGEYQTAPPFGYKMENKKLVVVPHEAEIVRIIFEKFIAREMSRRVLALYINDLGVKSKNGNYFDMRTIEYILNNPVYIGKTRWTPTGKARRNWNHPDSIIADGKHEPIISQELWDKAQEVSKEYKELFPHKIRTTAAMTTWLKGLVRCGSCDRVMVRTHKIFLQCNAYSKGKCKTSNMIKVENLENLILEVIKRDFTTPLELNIAPKVTDYQNNAEYEILMRQLSSFDMKYDRIKQAYHDGIDTLEEYKRNKQTLKIENQKLKDRLTELKETLLNADEEQPIEKRLKDVHDLLTDKSIDIELKYQTAHFLISKITFDRQEKTLVLQYKL